MSRYVPHRSSKRVSRLTAPMCARDNCRHHRLRHGRRANGTTYCLGNTRWPYTDPNTGAAVAYAHCGCPGFVEQQST